MKKLIFLLCVYGLVGCDYRDFVPYNDVGNTFLLSHKEATGVDGITKIKYFPPEEVSEWVDVINRELPGDNSSRRSCESLGLTISFIQDTSLSAMDYLVPWFRGYSHLTEQEVCEKITTVPLGGQFLIQTTRRSRPNNILDYNDYYIEYVMTIDGLEIIRDSKIGFLYSANPDIDGFFYFGANMRIEESLRPDSEIVIQVLDQKHNSVDTFTLTHIGS